ncbi:hypothetical protein V8F20_009209 [Naviculisporaceae sp. PSN 640]
MKRPFVFSSLFFKFLLFTVSCKLVLLRPSSYTPTQTSPDISSPRQSVQRLAHERRRRRVLVASGSPLPMKTGNKFQRFCIQTLHHQRPLSFDSDLVVWLAAVCGQKLDSKKLRRSVCGDASLTVPYLFVCHYGRLTVSGGKCDFVTSNVLWGHSLVPPTHECLCLLTEQIEPGSRREEYHLCPPVLIRPIPAKPVDEGGRPLARAPWAVFVSF